MPTTKAVLLNKELFPKWFEGWHDLLIKHWIRPCRSEQQQQNQVIMTVIRKYCELFHDDMFDGKEIGFWRNNEPYMAMSIRDFKNVSKRYRWKAKFRGHYYKEYLEMSYQFEKKMYPFRIFPWMEKFLYLRLSRLVRAGRDYDEVPNPLYHYHGQDHYGKR